VLGVLFQDFNLFLQSFKIHFRKCFCWYFLKFWYTWFPLQWSEVNNFPIAIFVQPSVTWNLINFSFSIFYLIFYFSWYEFYYPQIFIIKLLLIIKSHWWPIRHTIPPSFKNINNQFVLCFHISFFNQFLRYFMKYFFIFPLLQNLPVIILLTMKLFFASLL